MVFQICALIAVATFLTLTIFLSIALYRLSRVAHKVSTLLHRLDEGSHNLLIDGRECIQSIHRLLISIKREEESVHKNGCEKIAGILKTISECVALFRNKK